MNFKQLDSVDSMFLTKDMTKFACQFFLGRWDFRRAEAHTVQGGLRDKLLWVCGPGTLGQGSAFRAGSTARRTRPSSAYIFRPKPEWAPDSRNELKD